MVEKSCTPLSLTYQRYNSNKNKLYEQINDYSSNYKIFNAVIMILNLSSVI